MSRPVPLVRPVTRATLSSSMAVFPDPLVSRTADLPAADVAFGTSASLRVGLVRRHRGDEGLESHAGVVDPADGGVRLEVGTSTPRADHLGDEADVGERGPVPVAEPAGLRLAGESPLERPEALLHPVPAPRVPRRLVEAERVLQVT